MRAETEQQLAALLDQLRGENSTLYRHWALYLQVLRDSLGGAVDKACFQLAVSELPERYTGLPQAARQQLHARLAALVSRTAALLTVEQLHALAAQTEQRRQRAAVRQRRRLLAAMQQSPPEPAETLDPPGSVHLGLDPPLSPDLFGQQASPAELDDSADNGERELLLQAFAQLLEQQGNDAAEGDRAVQAGGKQEGLLPNHPVVLLRWMEGLQAALVRRLRNLSHAINVELVRQGLSTTLLPIRVLEAITRGQVEVQNAPPHLVRLALSDAQLPQLNGADILCVLLQPAELEAELPKLRTCRSRLQQARQEIRRMAKIVERLEHRLQAQDAEALWLQDHSTVHPGESPSMG